MTPFRFGTANRPMQGILHAAAGPSHSGHAVLICNPFGQEAIRLHRFCRVLAERLARHGVPVLRFDYYGTGDSGGTDRDGDLVGWALDIETAHHELVRRCGNLPVALFGARIGASLACLASRHLAPDRLVLWEPVIDGPGYVQDLRQRHRLAMAAHFPLRPAAFAEPASDEALGFAVSAVLAGQLHLLSPRIIQAAKSGRLDLVTATAATNRPFEVRPQLNADALGQWHLLDQPFDWTTEEAMNTALVPGPALDLIARLLGLVP
ncbi:MAG: serine aminopeptidase domain-containing protein [Aquabacterium sp.]